MDKVLAPAKYLRAILPTTPTTKRGRPSVMTDSVVGKLEQAFMHDCTVEEACVYAGIHKDTYYEFCKQYPEFPDRVAALRCYPTLVAKRTVINAILNGNTRLAWKYLERKLPQEFSSRTSINVLPPSKGNIDEPTHGGNEPIAMFEKVARENINLPQHSIC